MRRRVHLNKLAFRLFAGWCGLLLYVGALSPLGLGVGVLLAAIDSDHHAILHPGVDGMRLVLRHQANCAAHHHGTVARALTMFAQPASTTDPDHVVQFSSASSFVRESEPAIPAASQTAASAIVFTEPISPVTPKPDQFVPPPRPPPDRVANLLNVRSTIFLI